MSFNHYAKIKRILENESGGWYICRIDTPTKAKNFKGEIIHYPHYYRIFSTSGAPIPYCKFQHIDRLAHILQIPIDALPFERNL